MPSIIPTREGVRCEGPTTSQPFLRQARNLARLKRLLVDNFEMTEAYAKLRITSKKNQKTYRTGAGTTRPPTSRP
jgi:hypothetical protein